GELRRDHPRVRHRPRKPRSAAGPAARYPLPQVARAGPAGVTASTHPGESYGNRLGECVDEGSGDDRVRERIRGLPACLESLTRAIPTAFIPSWPSWRTLLACQRTSARHCGTRMTG